MLYYLAEWLTPSFNILNVLTYHTVRAGASAISAFLFCLLIGPPVIRYLRARKLGQPIKKEHVAALHELHKGKSGTPTMGGILILTGVLFALLLWGRLDNRLLWMAVIVCLILGAVGFLDDYIKLIRKHNSGLSARAKLTGQLVAGGILGIWLYWSPITASPVNFSARDVLDWQKLVQELHHGNPNQAMARIRERMGPASLGALNALQQDPALITDPGIRSTLLQGLNTVLSSADLYDPDAWQGIELPSSIESLLNSASGTENLSDRKRINRALIEAVLPGAVAASRAHSHTSIGVPGFKDLFIPLGPLYILFVIFVIISISNAVNLTDGLDGLAAGASTISVITYAGIAYIVSRADWSRYLYLTFVPEASELFVFGGAVLGAGLGFLWYNCYPAQVFMGDTGSLSLGGAIGAMALLTKQELLLPVVAGLFVLEALSVVLQVASFKLTGKRLFRMAPLHHHFEISGWQETQVTTRFLIIALLFSLMSLGALKLR
ncbi:MAG TPA: phospho-N-acetylmuramoyl-pentapeptide-transferase [Candidatus Hydrogenedentes bacterium]|nr:phospho-N-acetylmuramoyl-pentapeptide-transferase [Candidatus Hydrogenedentota bacterium]